MAKIRRLSSYVKVDAPQMGGIYPLERIPSLAEAIQTAKRELAEKQKSLRGQGPNNISKPSRSLMAGI